MPAMDIPRSLISSEHISWLPEDPVPCTQNPDLWADSSVYKIGNNQKYAINICHNECPVVVTCLAKALEFESNQGLKLLTGIRGGTTPAERRTLIRNHKKSNKKK